jgi:hypothetical protein
VHEGCHKRCGCVGACLRRALRYPDLCAHDFSARWIGWWNLMRTCLWTPCDGHTAKYLLTECRHKSPCSSKVREGARHHFTNISTRTTLRATVCLLHTSYLAARFTCSKRLLTRVSFRVSKSNSHCQRSTPLVQASNSRSDPGGIMVSAEELGAFAVRTFAHSSYLEGSLTADTHQLEISS